MSRRDHTLRMSRHADIRCQQRGVRSDVLTALLMWTDIDIGAGKGRSHRRVSRDEADKLLRAGLISPTVHGRLRRMDFIQAPNGDVVTVLRSLKRRTNLYRGRR